MWEKLDSGIGPRFSFVRISDRKAEASGRKSQNEHDGDESFFLLLSIVVKTVRSQIESAGDVFLLTGDTKILSWRGQDRPIDVEWAQVNPAE